MNSRGAEYGRPDNSEKLKTYVRDSENTMTLNLNDHTGNRFIGHWNKLINMQQFLFWEDKEKYLNEYNAKFNARLELGSIPLCFGQCVNDVEAPGSLSSDEKNCMRECYFKRVSAKYDMAMHFQQKLAIENLKGMKDNLL